MNKLTWSLALAPQLVPSAARNVSSIACPDFLGEVNPFAFHKILANLSCANTSAFLL